jgi:hypothetical protein
MRETARIMKRRRWRRIIKYIEEEMYNEGKK